MTPISKVRAVLFDAVGTLIYANPPVVEVYHSAGRQFGSVLDRGEIAERFAAALSRHAGGNGEPDNREPDNRQPVNGQPVNGQPIEEGSPTVFPPQPTDQRHERRRWRRIVADVFHDLPQAHEPLFQQLWKHFSARRHWTVFDDVASCWQRLERRGLKLGVASNFDDRLYKLCESLDPLTGCPLVFASASVGFAKPSREFFSAVAARLALPAEQILMVGDDLTSDYLGATAAGWQAILLDRRERDRDERAIASLAELPDLLASD